MRNKLDLPAISHELTFLARHIDEAHDVWDGNVKADKDLIALLDFVYDRAEPEVEELLESTQQAVNEGANGILRVTWARIQLDNWEMAGSISLPRGRVKNIATIGFYVKCQAVHGILGWIHPRGGREGRNRLQLDAFEEKRFLTCTW